jgi:hypothetical protein
MAKLRLPLHLAIWIAAVCLAVSVGLTIFGVARADVPDQGTEEYCLSCHGNPDLQMTLPSGEVLPLYISSDKLEHSIHSPLGIECEACHT